jgi:hypothetical protein
MEEKDVEKNNTTGVYLGTFQIHIENIEDGGVVRSIYDPTVRDLVQKIRRVGWKMDSVSFYWYYVVQVVKIELCNNCDVDLLTKNTESKTDVVIRFEFSFKLFSE